MKQFLFQGEFVAFVIGWNLLLEYIIGSASIAKGLSLYIDSLIDNAMKKYFYSIAPLHLGEFLSSYFDFFAFGGPLLLGLALAFGLRKSAGMNNIFCILNLGVVLYVVVTVIMNANLDYWRIDPSMVPEEHKNATIGAGGFFPFGFSGTIKGAATCFFGFVGFDCIATTGEYSIFLAYYEIFYFLFRRRSSESKESSSTRNSFLSRNNFPCILWSSFIDSHVAVLFISKKKLTRF